MRSNLILVSHVPCSHPHFGGVSISLYWYSSEVPIWNHFLSLNSMADCGANRFFTFSSLFMIMNIGRVRIIYYRVAMCIVA